MSDKNQHSYGFNVKSEPMVQDNPAPEPGKLFFFVKKKLKISILRYFHLKFVLIDSVEKVIIKNEPIVMNTNPMTIQPQVSSLAVSNTTESLSKTTDQVDINCYLVSKEIFSFIFIFKLN